MKTRADYERELRECLALGDGERRRRSDAFLARLRAENEATEARRDAARERIGWTGDPRDG